MAIILKGKHKGKKVKIHQWCNDWITVEELTQPFSPMSLQYTSEEFRMILFNPNNGDMFELYEPDYNNYRFKRKKNNG